MAASNAEDRWDAFHRRLKDVEAGIKARLAPSPAQEREILTRRAEALAVVSDAHEASAQTWELIAFTLGGTHYAIDAKAVAEVIDLKDLAVLPGTPPHVAGLINIRGRLLTVFDLRSLFGLPKTGLYDSRKVIILRDASLEIGLLADTLIGMTSMPDSELQPYLPILNDIPSSFVKGVIAQETIVLSVESILAEKKLTIDETRT